LGAWDMASSLVIYAVFWDLISLRPGTRHAETKEDSGCRPCFRWPRESASHGRAYGWLADSENARGGSPRSVARPRPV